MFDLKRFARDLNLTQRQIGEMINVDQSVVSDMTKGKRRIRLEHVAKLRGQFGDVVDDYISGDDTQLARAAAIIGNGNAQVVGNNNNVVTTAEAVVATIAPDGGVLVVEQPPFVPESVVRKPEINVMEWVENEESDHSQSAFNIASILRRTKFVIQMNNNAMAPTLYQGEYVFLKPFAEGSEIIDGEVYGIETRSHGILIRFLYDDGDAILARPKNAREFGVIRVPKENIEHKYHIVFHGSTHLSSMPDNEGERDKQIKQQGEQINALIGQLGTSMQEISKAGERTDKLLEQNNELFRRILDTK